MWVHCHLFKWCYLSADSKKHDIVWVPCIETNDQKNKSSENLKYRETRTAGPGLLAGKDNGVLCGVAVASCLSPSQWISTLCGLSINWKNISKISDLCSYTTRASTEGNPPVPCLTLFISATLMSAYATLMYIFLLIHIIFHFWENLLDWLLLCSSITSSNMYQKNKP